MGIPTMVLTTLRRSPEAAKSNERSCCITASSPSLSFRFSRSNAGILPHKYWFEPNGAKEGPVMKAGMRLSRTHPGTYGSLRYFALQVTLSDFQSAVWHSLPQYCLQSVTPLLRAANRLSSSRIGLEWSEAYLNQLAFDARKLGFVLARFRIFVRTSLPIRA